MNAIDQIIKSILDNDFYTLTVGQVAFQEFPNLVVRYEFINRGKTQFPEGFADELQRQIELMSKLALTDHEYEYLESKELFSYDYLQFLKAYSFDPSEVDITQTGGDLSVSFYGKWERTIMWEVPFLALVSELYFKMTGKVLDPGWRIRLVNKCINFSNGGCKVMEFGTRRRFSFEVQDRVIKTMKAYKGFLGTSNVFLAMFHGVPCLGTMSHQGPMAMQAVYGATLSNKKWREVWKKVYKGKLMIYLPDTVTTDVFLRDFTREEALEWNLRQDSGDPDVWLTKVLAFYDANGISAYTKTAVLSDSLDIPKAVNYNTKYRSLINLVFGIGTNLTNDCGHKHLNIVVKLTGVTMVGRNEEMTPVVKLSDTNGKYTGNSEAIAKAKKELNIS